jgi:hypothetical protein
LVIKLAIDNRLPAIFWRSDFAEKGGFMVQIFLTTFDRRRFSRQDPSRKQAPRFTDRAVDEVRISD